MLLKYRPFVSVGGKVRRADGAVVRFSPFAGAAFVCSRSTCVVATQRVSSFRSFVGVVQVDSETVLSPQAVPTLQSRASAAVAAPPMDGCFARLATAAKNSGVEPHKLTSRNEVSAFCDLFEHKVSKDADPLETP